MRLRSEGWGSASLTMLQKLGFYIIAFCPTAADDRNGIDNVSTTIVQVCAQLPICLADDRTGPWRRFHEQHGRSCFSSSSTFCHEVVARASGTISARW